MRRTDEIVNNSILRNIHLSSDGGAATLHIGRWDGSVIWSTGAGWSHVSVSPFAKRIIPEYEDMCKIKDIFWNEDEDVIHIFPNRKNYVNNVKNCIHLWSCTYKPMVLPPSCLVGIRDGQSIQELKEEIKQAYELAGEKYE